MSLAMVASVTVVVALVATPTPLTGLDALGKLSPKALQAMVEGGDEVAVLIETASSDYAPLVATVQDLGGSVGFQYKYISAISASVPAAKLLSVANHPLVTGISLDEVRILNTAGDGMVLPTRAKANPDFESLAGVPFELPQTFRTYSLSPSQVREIGPAVYNLGVTGALGIHDAWERANFGEGATIAIIDTGICTCNFMLEESAVGGIDLSPDQRTPFHGWNRPHNHWHGSHVAGIAVGHGAIEVPAGSLLVQAIEQESGVTLPEGSTPSTKIIPLFGMAPLAKVYVIKVFPHTGAGVSESVIIQAINHAIDVKDEFGIDVISMSLGGPTLFDGRDLEDRTVDAAVDSGIVVVSAAGNDGPVTMTVASPGSAHKGIAVAAAAMPVNVRVFWDFALGNLAAGQELFVSDEPQIISFSSRGPTADGRMKPDVAAPGVFILSAFPLVGSPHALAFASGTSMATPHVSGASLLVQAFAEINGFASDMSPTDVKQALKVSASTLSLYDTRDFGAGLIDISAALDILSTGPTESDLSELTEAIPVEDIEEGSLSASVTLLPGESLEVIVPTSLITSNITLGITDVDLGTDAPNAGTWLDAFGWEQPQVNSLEVYIHGAKRGGSFFDYEVDSANVWGDAQFWVSDEETNATGSFRLDTPFKPFGIFNARLIEPGFYKIVIENDYTSFDEISFTYEVTVETESLPAAFDTIEGTVIESLEQDDFFIEFFVMPDGVASASFQMTWPNDWSQYPTDDLDLVLLHLDDNFEVDFADAQAATLNSPELSVISNPDSGLWVLVVIGFSIPITGESTFTVQIFLETG